MDEFTQKMYGGLLLVAGTISKWDEMTDACLDDFEGQLNVFSDAITYERELRQAALEAAGGADTRGDTNRAQKAATAESAASYIENLKV